MAFTHLVATRLEGDVKMGHKTATFCQKTNDFICEQVGFDGRDAVSIYGRLLVQGLDQNQKTGLLFWEGDLR
jgi:hypothetical protein